MRVMVEELFRHRLIRCIDYDALLDLLKRRGLLERFLTSVRVACLKEVEVWRGLP